MRELPTLHFKIITPSFKFLQVLCYSKQCLSRRAALVPYNMDMASAMSQQALFHTSEKRFVENQGNMLTSEINSKVLFWSTNSCLFTATKNGLAIDKH